MYSLSRRKPAAEPNRHREGQSMEFTVSPHGDNLCELLIGPEAAEQLNSESKDFPSVTLTHRQHCDLELLMNGAFSPLRGFMTRSEYESVVETMRLPSGLLWPIPIVLDVPSSFAEKLEVGQQLALRDGEGFMPAVLTVADVWQVDKAEEAENVYGTQSIVHPGVRYLYEQQQDWYVGGRIEGIQLPPHYDFENLWDTPEGLRNLFSKMGWRQVVALHSSNPMHRVHRELALQVAKDVQAHILLHPAVGMTKPGDLHYYARVHCYQAIRRHFPHNLAIMSLLPLAMRMAGPREAIWHAIVNQNYGCSHFIVGPGHASPPTGRVDEEEFYGKTDAQKLVAKYASELHIKPVAVEEMRYSTKWGGFYRHSKLQKEGEEGERISGQELKRRLSHGEDIPRWFSYPEVLRELRKVYPPRSKQGFTLFFTGLSGAGKSTLAKIIYAKLIEAGGRPVTLLDGDIVRHNLSSELGFSKEHRDLNVRRIGFVAEQITKNAGVAICAPIAPYSSTRAVVRDAIEQHGVFIEIYVATPLDVCESRDRKGLYSKARKGLIPEFTGVSDPYEEPQNPELRIDTSNLGPMEAAQEIFLYLLREGFLDTSDSSRMGQP